MLGAPGGGGVEEWCSGQAAQDTGRRAPRGRVGQWHAVGGVHHGRGMPWWGTPWVGYAVGGVRCGWRKPWVGYAVGGVCCGWGTPWVEYTMGGVRCGWGTPWVGDAVGGVRHGWGMPWVGYAMG